MECAKENTTSELRKKKLKRIRVVKDDNYEEDDHDQERKKLRHVRESKLHFLF